MVLLYNRRARAQVEDGMALDQFPGEKDRFGMVQDLPHCHKALAAGYEFAIGEEALALVLLSFATLGAHSLRAVPLAAGAPIAAAAAGGAMAGGAGMVLSK